MPRPGLLATMRKASGAALSSSYVAHVISTADLSTYTYAGASLGAAAADRRIVVVGHARKSGASTTVTSVTIGGVSATIDKQATRYQSNSTVAFIASAHVPTGTTGDVVVTYGATMLRASVGIYRVTGGALSVKASDSLATNTGPTMALSAMSTVADGVIIAGASWAPASGTGTSTWTAPTEDYDAEVESAFFRATGAHAATTGSPVTVSVTSAALTVSECALVAVAYQGA